WRRNDLMANLNWKVLTKKRPGVTQGLPPGTEDLAWVTNTVTLIHGEHDAILVDTFLSVQHSKDLVDWLAESGKNLVAVYITHAHSRQNIRSSASSSDEDGSPAVISWLKPQAENRFLGGCAWPCSTAIQSRRRVFVLILCLEPEVKQTAPPE